MKDIILRFKEAIIGLRVDIVNGRDYSEMFNEVRRLYRHVETCLADLLTLDEERDLREALSQIDNFFLVDIHSNVEVKRECVELMREVQEAIRNYFAPRSDSVELEEKELRDILSNCLNRETIDELLKDLSNPQLKKQSIAHIYNKYNEKCVLKDSGISFKLFCKSAVRFLHKEGLKGWNENNIKKFL